MTTEEMARASIERSARSIINKYHGIRITQNGLELMLVEELRTLYEEIGLLGYKPKAYKAAGTMRYYGVPKIASKEIFNRSIYKASIPKGVFYDTKYKNYIIHNSGSLCFDKVVRQSRYLLVGVYNRYSTHKDIWEDMTETLGGIE